MIALLSAIGGKPVTVKNLQIVDIESDKNLLFVKGAVPGPANGIIEINKRTI